MVAYYIGFQSVLPGTYADTAADPQSQFGLDDTIFWRNGADIAPEYLYDHGIAIA